MQVVALLAGYLSCPLFDSSCTYLGDKRITWNEKFPLKRRGKRKVRRVRLTYDIRIAQSVRRYGRREILIEAAEVCRKQD